MLALLGLSSGLFIVPLNAYLQQRAEAHEKGRLIATNNFSQHDRDAAGLGDAVGMHDRLHVGSDKLILIFGLATMGDRLHRLGGAGFPDSLRAVDGDPFAVPHSHRGPGKRAVARTGAAGGEPYCRTWMGC
jgi:hypothetical protein